MFILFLENTNKLDNFEEKISQIKMPHVNSNKEHFVVLNNHCMHLCFIFYGGSEYRPINLLLR